MTPNDKQHPSTKPIKLVHVVAIDNNRCIGKDNQLAWHIPDDLQHFKRLTLNGVIIMGRKTFESLGRPLPKRTNIVITRNADYAVPSGVLTFGELEEAIAHGKTLAKNAGQSQIFIIGGGELYRQSLPLADVLEITQVDLAIDGDTFYPELGDDFVETWHSPDYVDETSGTRFRFGRYERQV